MGLSRRILHLFSMQPALPQDPPPASLLRLLHPGCSSHVLTVALSDIIHQLHWLWVQVACVELIRTRPLTEEEMTGPSDNRSVMLKNKEMVIVA